VALQGTLDTFGLPDVLRLLASTRKTGRLRITGDRSAGSVWLDGGAVVAGTATTSAASTELAYVVFDLLRCDEGSFVFEPDVNSVEPGVPTDVEVLVSQAEKLLEEWREIEAVVPSLALWVSLVADLPRPEVVVNAERWRALVAVGGGVTVGAIGASLSLGEMPVSRLVKELVEQGLVELSEPQPASIEPVLAAVDDLVVARDEYVEAETSTPEPTVDEAIPGVDGEAPDSWKVAEPWQSATDTYPPAVNERHAPGSGIDIPGLPSLGGWGSDFERHIEEHENNDVSVELGPLTPRAARAIAAAAQASNEAERESAIQQAIEANEQPLDRGVLLRFLSSVRQ
jgi:hypothetical protein